MQKDAFSVPEGLPQKISSAKSFLVVLAQNLNVDNIAAGLALFLSLRKKKAKVKIGAPNEITVEFNRLFGVDKISQKIGSRNLVISFPEDMIEKVSSQIESGKLNLVIQPKNNSQLPALKELEYSYSGIDADIIFIIGAQKLKDLGVFYGQEKQVFDKKETVNIDINPANTKFAKNNLVFPEQVALSQILAKLIKKLNLPADKDIATNLIAGIESATNNFQTRTTADIFETIAWAMRQGGKQGHLKSDGLQPAKSPFAPDFTPVDKLPGKPATPPALFTQPQPALVQPQLQPQPAPAPPAPPFVPDFAKASPGTATTSIQNQQTATEKEEEQNPPPAPAPDWFKPKIFSGGMRKG